MILWTQDFYGCLPANLVLSRTLPLFLLTFLVPSATIPPTFYRHLAALTKEIQPCRSLGQHHHSLRPRV